MWCFSWIISNLEGLQMLFLITKEVHNSSTTNICFKEFHLVLKVDPNNNNNICGKLPWVAQNKGLFTKFNIASEASCVLWSLPSSSSTSTLLSLSLHLLCSPCLILKSEIDVHCRTKHEIIVHNAKFNNVTQAQNGGVYCSCQCYRKHWKECTGWIHQNNSRSTRITSSDQHFGCIY